MTLEPESIEWFIEDQAFFGSAPTPLPPSPVSNLSLFLGLSVCRRLTLLAGGGKGVGEEPKHMTASKPGPL